MLDYYSFKDEFVTRCNEALAGGSHDTPDYPVVGIKIEEKTVTKAQFGQLTGLIFKAEDNNCAPTYYMEDIYGMYLEGMSLDELALGIVKSACTMVTNPPELADEDSGFIEDPANLRIRILNKSRNSTYLERIPSLDVGCGLVLTAEMRSGEYSAAVTADLMEMLGLTKEELFERAMENSAASDKATLYEISDVLANGTGQCSNMLDPREVVFNGPITPGSLYVLSNNRQFQGATVLFYPGMLDRLYSIMGGDFYILPSSVHEVLLLPLSEEDADKLTGIIRSANREVVSDADFLSDDLLVCRSGKLQLVRNDLC